jgi:uroporphyrinogen-III synthase
LKIKSILVSQPAPTTEKSPYFDLAQKYNIKIDFRPFIKIEGIPAKDFRRDRITILEHSAIIFTSKTAIDHFFRVCEESKIVVPDDMKYFCISESTAFYLQKYIVYRKRKIFFSQNTFDELLEIFSKHKEEKFLLPLSDIHKPEIPAKLDKQKYKYNKAILYKTVCADLSDLNDVKYDILVFFSPTEIHSLLTNFPDFKQENTVIAAFGTSTHKAIKDAGLRLDIKAPTPTIPSMTMAIDNFVKKFNKNGK